MPISSLALLSLYERGECQNRMGSSIPEPVHPGASLDAAVCPYA